MLADSATANRPKTPPNTGRRLLPSNAPIATYGRLEKGSRLPAASRLLSARHPRPTARLSRLPDPLLRENAGRAWSRSSGARPQARPSRPNGSPNVWLARQKPREFAPSQPDRSLQPQAPTVNAPDSPF